MSFVIKGRRLEAVFGTDGDDEIIVKCGFDLKLLKQKCEISANSECRTFLATSEMTNSLLIDTGAGNDLIKISVSSDITLDDIRVKPGSGENHVYTELHYPFSYGVVELDPDSINTLHFTKEGSNIFVVGFKDSPSNKIQIDSEKQVISVELLPTKSEIYGLFLPNQATPFLSLLNTLTPEQLENEQSNPGELVDYFHVHNSIIFNN